MSNNNGNQQMITPSNSHICSQYIIIMQIIAFGIYFIFAYTEIPNDLHNKTLTKCFLSYLVMYLAQIINTIITIKHIQHYKGIRMRKDLFEYLNPINRFPFSLIKTCNTVMFCLGIYILIKFIPFSTGCDIYDGYYHPCTALQIISVFAMIELGFVALLVTFALLFMLYACVTNPIDGCKLCLHCTSLICVASFVAIFESCLSCVSSNNNNQNINNNEVANMFKRQVSSYLPISSTSPPADGTCAICTDEEQINEQWKELSCGHKFHNQCILSWFITQQSNHHSTTCPMCRIEVSLLTV